MYFWLSRDSFPEAGLSDWIQVWDARPDRIKDDGALGTYWSHADWISPVAVLTIDEAKMAWGTIPETDLELIRYKREGI